LIAIGTTRGGVGVAWEFSGNSGRRRDPSQIGLHFVTQPAKVDDGESFEILSQSKRISWLGIRIGTSWYAETDGSVSHFGLIDIPCWPLAAATSVLASLWIARRRTVLKKGHCIACGYDLRASKERCPECGREIPASNSYSN
jgi:hypothetical protein